MASRAGSSEDLKLVTRENKPDGVIVYALYGEKKDRVVLIRQYRFSIGDYIYEFPAGLVDEGEDFHEAGIRELKEETGLSFHPIEADPLFTRPYFTTVGMTDESCAAVYGTADGVFSLRRAERRRRDRDHSRRQNRDIKNPSGGKCLHHVCLYDDALSSF